MTIAVLISGRGSNMKALVNELPGLVTLVISNVADAPGLEFARARGIETLVIDHRDYKDRSGFEAALGEAISARPITLVCLAGFMRILGPAWFERVSVPTLNIHPSLLPRHKGLNTHQAALDAGDTEHGCTVHIVTPALDDGEIIVQRRVPVLPGDTVDSLSARVLIEEHSAYPEAVRKFL